MHLWNWKCCSICARQLFFRFSQALLWFSGSNQLSNVQMCTTTGKTKERWLSIKTHRLLANTTKAWITLFSINVWTLWLHVSPCRRFALVAPSASSLWDDHGQALGPANLSAYYACIQCIEWFAFSCKIVQVHASCFVSPSHLHLSSQNSNFTDAWTSSASTCIDFHTRTSVSSKICPFHGVLFVLFTLSGSSYS